ncbi:MAG: FAD-dependent oxidoreductase [Planctomycetota bacterium]|nr:FAD-dependent oxidoreductase [Planctomycetota bacterium]
MARSLIAQLASRYGTRRTVEERRAFLKATLATSAGLLLSSGAIAGLAPLSRDSRKRVVVIGGGFAGLACAHELVAAGYDVTLLEARERVGGRVLSFNAGNKNEYIRGRNIEGGAELIGSNHPAWVNYATKFGLEWLDVTDDEGECESPVVIDGKPLPAGEGGELWEHLEAALAKLNALAESIDADEPWKSADAAALDKKSTMEWINSLDVPAQVKRAMWINQTSDNGQDASKQSFLGQLAAVKGGGLEKYWSDSEVYRCKSGNDSLAHRLADGIGRDRLITGLPVRSIMLKGDRMLVEARDSRTIECDDVVLAVPPTMWKKIEISPHLPAAMAPQMGLNAKHFAHVKTRFWETSEPKRSQFALSDGLFMMTWDATDAQGPVGPDNDGACLVGFAGGPSVERALRMTKEEREAAFAQAYEAFYPGFKDHLVQTRYMDWPNDPWVMASYSFPAPGQVTTVGPLMAQAHASGRLHLAGEHTCYKFVGYMEGALDSGIRIAKRLAARDGVTK